MNSHSPGTFNFVLFCLLALTSSVQFETSPSCNPMVCACSEPHLKANCSNRGFLATPKSLPSSIVFLDLSGNDIEVLNTTELSRLSDLKRLDLSKNRLNQFTSIVHYSLESLDLSFNNISSVRSLQLKGLIKLTELNLAQNKIVSIPGDAFAGSVLLKTLNLRANGIVSLEPGCLDQLTSLQELILTKNRLSTLPKGLFQRLNSLQLLELNKNKFVEIQGLSFHGLTNLKVLKLKRNQIEFLMDGAFFGLNKIEELSLDNNKVNVIEKGWLYGLYTLKSLSMANNKVEYITDDSWEFCHVLHTLNLNSNKLQLLDRDSLRKLPQLKHLYLENNRISHIQDDDTFAEVPLIETLTLDGNEISHTIEDMYAPFKGLKYLKKLTLSLNQIKSIGEQAFVGLEHLEELNLEKNVISTMQENAFAHLERIKSIHMDSSSMLCDCYLKWFPLWINETSVQGCQATCAHPENLKGMKISSIDYESFTCDDFPKPYILQQPETQITLKGNNLTLVCRAASTSPVDMKFEWKIDTDPLEYPNDSNCGEPTSLLDRCVRTIDHSFDGKGRDVTSQLHLSNLTYDDAGKYQCVVSNSYGATYSDKANITVYVYPQFVVTPEDITVEGGATAALKCAARGVPAPKVSWSKDLGTDFPAATERRIAVSSFVDNSDKKTNINSFVIYGVKAKDMGVYQCTATNPAGSISWNISLSVLELPRFVKPMENKNVPEGETAVIECLAAGSPKPRLTWTKDDVNLDGTKGRHFFTADNQLLIIVNVQKEDAGRYQCTMHNQLGTESQTSIINVNSLGSIAPGFKSPDTDQTVETKGGLGNPSIGIIIIAVVCVLLGTSMVWVCIIFYRVRQRRRRRSLPERLIGASAGDGTRGLTARQDWKRGDQGKGSLSVMSIAGKPGEGEFDINEHVRRGLMRESPLGQTQLDQSTGVLTTDLSRTSDIDERDSGTGDSKNSRDHEEVIEEKEEVENKNILSCARADETDALLSAEDDYRTFHGAGESTISLSEFDLNGKTFLGDHESSVIDVEGGGEGQCDMSLSSSLSESIENSVVVNNTVNDPDSVQFRTFHPKGRREQQISEEIGFTTILDLDKREQPLLAIQKHNNKLKNYRKRASAVELNGECYLAIEPEPRGRSVINLVEPSVYRGGIGSLPRHGLDYEQELLEASLNSSNNSNAHDNSSSVQQPHHRRRRLSGREALFGDSKSRRHRSLSRGKLKFEDKRNMKNGFHENTKGIINPEHSNVVLKSKDMF